MSELLTRVGIIGDPHAEDELLEKAIHFLRGEGVETLLCTGDVVDGRGDANRCCELLEAERIPTVRGNHDRWYFSTSDHPETNLTLSARSFLMTLPAVRRFDTPQGALLLCHGLGDDDMAGFYPDERDEILAGNSALQNLIRGNRYRYVVSGHTHISTVRALSRTIFINGGTLMWGYRQCFMLADFASGRVQEYLFDARGTISLGVVSMLPDADKTKDSP